MRETFFCPQCALHKPIEAKIERPGKKPSCRSCHEKAQKHINERDEGARHAKI